MVWFIHLICYFWNMNGFCFQTRMIGFFFKLINSTVFFFTVSWYPCTLLLHKSSIVVVVHSDPFRKNQVYRSIWIYSQLQSCTHPPQMVVCRLVLLEASNTRFSPQLYLLFWEVIVAQSFVVYVVFSRLLLVV